MRITQCRQFAILLRMLTALERIRLLAPIPLGLGSLAIAVMLVIPGPCSAAQLSRLDLVFLVDNSSAFAAAHNKEDLRETLSDRILASDGENRIALICYDDVAYPLISLTRVTSANQHELIEALDMLEVNTTYSNVAAGLERAIYEFKRNGRPHAERQILLIHGGEIRTGDFEQDQLFQRWAVNILARKAARMSIKVQGIAFGKQTDTELLKKITDITGGTRTQVFSNDDLRRILDLGRPMVAKTGSGGTLSWPERQDPNHRKRLGSDQGNVVPTTRSLADVVQIPDRTETVVKEVSASINVMTSGSPTQAGLTSPVSEVSTKLTSKLSPDIAAASEVPHSVYPSRTTNRPLEVTSSNRRNTSTDGFTYILWAIQASIALICALSVFAYIRQRDQELSANERHSEQKSGVRLRDLSGVSEQSIHSITERSVRICKVPVGYGDDFVNITIPDDVISREHALILFLDGDYYLTDRRSDNGTFVNGRRIKAPRKLKDGDQIGFAHFEFAFERPATEPDTNPAQDIKPEVTDFFGRPFAHAQTDVT